jgi:stage V sporulation protein D (sporulation-specific penicillin-binding protein)
MNIARSRIRIALWSVILFVVIIIIRLYVVQVVKGDEYRRISDKQGSGTQFLFDRGTIFFTTREGSRVAAATVKEGYGIAMTPQNITDAETAYELIASMVDRDLDREEFLLSASKTDDPHEELVKRVDRDTGISIAELGIPGISVTPVAWRAYPAGSLASHTLGLVGYDQTNTLAGRYGLERTYEKILARTGSVKYRNFFTELFSAASSVGEEDGVSDDAEDLFNEVGEGNVVTTIEPSVQKFVEDALLDVEEKWQSDEIGVVVMDPKTGAIISMASLPGFDPNKRENITDPSVFSNPLVEHVYEMGSIIKPLTMASGLDSGAITVDSTYNDKGFLVMDGRRISNYDGEARGVVKMQEILSQSLNTGVAHIVSKMGKDLFSTYFKNLGLGEKSGIDQPNEQEGIVKNLNSTRDIEHATAAYGQGIAMSPVVTVRALATLANGGMLVTPHLVSSVVSEGGDEVEISFPEPRRVFEKKTTDDVTTMLVKVVDTALRGGAIKMPRYSIAAKTGTAQIADPVRGGYYDDRYLHSFFGYFPAYNPRFIVFLYHIYPKGANYASETLTDPFTEISQFLISYYQIPPDR